ncbi:MAG: hypothetical protein ABR906_06660 [Terracidiphilus sp.]|jgi:hypothetical protein
MIHLSANWAKDLVSQPETGMGYQIATVFLKDGRQFDKVAIIGGTVASVDGNSYIPFAEPDIEKIVVTHEQRPVLN